MKAASLVAAGLIVVFANAFALMHAARNRAGSPEAEITFTQRELQYAYRPLSDENSGVTLNLIWMGPGRFTWPVSNVDFPDWLDDRILLKLGFDRSVNPESADAERFYQRQRPRRAFVALENDGQAWQAWLKAAQQSRPATQFNVVPDGGISSHLVAIDADLDPGKLRARNPDWTKVVILPGVIAITLADWGGNPARHVKIVRGTIRELPSSIQVPRPFQR